MVFSTPVFVFVFLPLTLFGYYVVPDRLRNLVLFTASLLFYYWGEQIYVLIMVFSTLVDYTHGLLIEYWKQRNKPGLARITLLSSIILNLGLLIFFKYWDFIALSLKKAGIGFLPVLGIHLPIGISFFTFQTMSYTIDVYRGDVRAQHSMLRFGTFVTLFPQLIAGPIVKYHELGPQLEKRQHSPNRFSSGVQTFMIGLAKKLLIANTAGRLFEVYREASPSELTVLGAWLGLIAFTIQIYYDFSGYSDMAIGLGRMFGFELPENFNYPYISRSITEFWRRWHISLSTWFREYLYIPLGGNRCGRGRQFINLLLVWAATGIWHGASWNYLYWAMYFFVILMLEKTFLGEVLEHTPAVVRHIYALFLIVLGWAIFAFEDTACLLTYLKALFGFDGVAFADAGVFYQLRSYAFILLAAAIGSTPMVSRLYTRLPGRVQRFTDPILLIAGLLVCTASMVANTYNPFLYFRF